MDSITKVTPADAGAIVVSGSHGGASSGEFALEVPLKVVFFNDAGVGKENAGIAAGTVAHTSVKIGDAQDMWDRGVTSHVNETARGMGLAEGQALRDALCNLVA